MSQPETILLVEDNPDDVFFMQRAFRSLGIVERLEVANDGDEAIAYLSRPGLVRPELIILDLKLPGKSGLDVLQWIRQKSTIGPVVVVVLSTSRETSDINRAYELGASAYLVKPTALGELTTMVRAIKDFWLTFNCVPGRTASA